MDISRCSECGSDQIIHTTAQDTLTIGEQTFTAELPAVRCEACGAVFFNGPAVGELERAAARELAQRGPATAETFRFMRKALGIRAADLAEMLDVTPETISRWETGKMPVGRTTWLALSSLVLDYEGTTARLQAAQGGPGLVKVAVRLDLTRTAAR